MNLQSRQWNVSDSQDSLLPRSQRKHEDRVAEEAHSGLSRRANLNEYNQLDTCGKQQGSEHYH